MVSAHDPADDAAAIPADLPADGTMSYRPDTVQLASLLSGAAASAFSQSASAHGDRAADPPPPASDPSLGSVTPDTAIEAAPDAPFPPLDVSPCTTLPITRWSIATVVGSGEELDLPPLSHLRALGEVASPSDGLRPAGDDGAARGAGPTYRLRRVVGSGGFGDVWEAVQVSLGRVVAVKRLRAADREGGGPPSDAYRRAERLFRQEAYTTALLDHPNIVPVHDLGVDERDRALLAMKLVRGTPWDLLLEEDQATRDPQEVLDRHVPILMSVTQAVAFAHAHGIVHRDLKPHQVMVGAFGETLLMDWGLAVRWREDETRDGDADLPEATTRTPTPREAVSPAGTPAYMAPEQTHRDASGIGPWTDVYLLGGMLYHLLTGRPPHTGATSGDMFAAAAAGDILPFEATTEGARAPAELRGLALRAMSADPQARLPTAEAFHEALRDWQTGASRRREAAALVEQAAARIGDAPTAPDYAVLGAALGDLERATALWPGSTAAASLRDRALATWARRAVRHGDLVLARVQAERVRDAEERAALLADVAVAERRAERIARERRRLVAATVVLAVLLVAIFFNFRLYRVRAQAEIERQGRTAALVGRVDQLRRDEAAFTSELERVAPLPTSLSARRATIAPADAAELRARRDRLAEERRELGDLVGHGTLGAPAPSLVLAEANLLLATARDADDYLATLAAYRVADATIPHRPEPATGMGLAATGADLASEAVEHFAEALRRTERLLGRDHPDFLRALELHADALLGIGRDIDHAAAYREARELLAPRVAESLVKLSHFGTYLGDPEPALRWAAVAAEMIADVRPPLALDRLRADVRLAIALQQAGDAEGALAAAAGLDKRILAAPDIDPDRRLDDLGILASLHDDFGRPDDAERIFAAAFALAAELPDSSPATVGLLHNNYGLMLRRLDRFPEAEVEYRRALALATEGLGPDHTRTLTVANNLAILLSDIGRDEEAMPIHERVMHGFEQRFGAIHPETARAVEQYAISLLELERYEEAEPYYRRALDVRLATLGPDHPEVASSLNNIAMLHHRRGRLPEAVADLGRAIEILRADPDAHGRVLLIFTTNRATMLRDLGRIPEAEEDFRAAHDLAERLGLGDSLNASYLYSGEATMFGRLGRHDEAIASMERALAIRARVLGDDHDFAQMTREKLDDLRAAAAAATAAAAAPATDAPTDTSP